MKIILTAKTIIILLFYLVLVGFAVFVAIFVKDFFSEKTEIILPETEIHIAQNNENQECVFNIEERIVRGNSLSPLIENGDTVKVFFGYYECNEIKREDIILYSYAGNETLLIKIVKGIPGDKFTLQKTQVGCWNILINDKILENSQNSPYCISEQGYRMLSLYEKDYKGVVPEDAYLIMSNLTGGATDSTRYGLVHKNDILGKAITIKAEPQ